MRPQLAMAALLMLMIGASLIFLRARPGERSSVLVTERGMPETEADSIILPAQPPSPETATAANAPKAEAPAPAPTVAAGPSGASAREDGRSRGMEQQEAEKKSAAAPAQIAGDMARADDEAFGAMERAEERDFAGEALQQARELQQSSGCAAAAPRFEEVSARFPGTGTAAEATWRAAECRRLMGDVAQARQGYTQLLEVSTYRDRARAALAALNNENVASAEPPAASKPADANRFAPPPPAEAPAGPAAGAASKSKKKPAAASPAPAKPPASK
jgi:hypothetical protein